MVLHHNHYSVIGVVWFAQKGAVTLGTRNELRQLVT